MKRAFSLWLGLAAAALLTVVLAPAQAPQAPAGNTGKIHGRVINPTGQPQGGGTVSLSTDGGVTLKYTFPVDQSGNYTGEAPQGTYMVVYRAADTPAGKMVDSIRGIKIVAGEDIAQNVDMSRQEYIDKMTPEEKKQLEDLKKQNSEALKANVLINQLNADLRVVNQDKKDIDNAIDDCGPVSGRSASRTDIENKANEIRTAKYTDIVSLATKDTGLKPDEALLWNQLGLRAGRAQAVRRSNHGVQEGHRSGDGFEKAAHACNRSGPGRPGRDATRAPARFLKPMPRLTLPPRPIPRTRRFISRIRPSSSSSKATPRRRLPRRMMPSRPIRTRTIPTSPSCTTSKARG